MAFVRQEYCNQCEAQRQFINRKCSVCCERERREEMAKWKAKTTDEKLLDIHKRLLKLENGSKLYC